MSEDDVPEGRCGYVLEPEDVREPGAKIAPGDIGDSFGEGYEAETDEWYESSEAMCCWRSVWKEADSNRCVWHAEIDGKRSNELVEEKKDGWEHLDGAFLRNASIGDAISFEDCIMRSSNLAGSYLNETNFTRADLRNSNLKDTRLRNADFADAKLHNVSFEDTHSPIADFQGAVLLSVTAEEADFRNTDFSRTNMMEANFNEADLEETNFTKADLTRSHAKEANFQHSILDEAIMGRTELEEADFEWAELRGAYLKHTHLENANFKNAILTEATITSAILEGADLSEASLQDADFRESKLCDTNLDGVTADGASFRNVEFCEANMPGMNLSNQTLRRKSFVGANLQKANLQKADLQDAKLMRASIEEANLNDTNLRNANFAGANLTDADLTEANLRDVDLKAATLEDAVLTRTDLRGADLEYAELYQTLFSDIRMNNRTEFGETCQYEARDISPQNDDTVTPLEAAAWTYRRIQTLHEENALAQEAREFHVRKAEAYRKLRWREFADIWSRPHRDPGTWFTTLRHAVTYSATRRLSNHGENPVQVAWVSLLVILVWAVLYLFVGGIEQPPTPNGTTVVAFDLLPSIPIPLPGPIADLATSLYFSVVTFTTLGYGDLQPASGAAQALATVESFVGALLMALLVFVLGRRATW